MAIKAIEPKGIVHNLSKIAMQDGMSEDMVNLRLKDGTWRPAGEGRHVHTFSDVYTDMYIHTMSDYKHMLGVKDGVLYWFANVNADDTFTEITPVQVCAAPEGVNVIQTGHMLSVIGNGVNETFVFDTRKGEYTHLNLDANGAQNDRGVFPFGGVHFNLSQGEVIRHAEKVNDVENIPVKLAHEKMISAYGEVRGKNQFANPFLIVAAIKMYDGTYMLANNPALLLPGGELALGNRLCYYDGTVVSRDKESDYVTFLPPRKGIIRRNDVVVHLETLKEDVVPIFGYGADEGDKGSGVSTGVDTNVYAHTYIRGHNIVVSISFIDYIKQNKDLFKKVSFFVTQESYLYRMGLEDYKYAEHVITRSDGEKVLLPTGMAFGLTYNYIPPRRSYEDVVESLASDNFYLLKEYDVSDMQKGVFAIDLTKDSDKGVLDALTTRDTLNTESFYRGKFLPKVAYSYNARLHIANYKKGMYHGYPIDAFHLNGHSVKLGDEADVFLGTIKGLLPDNDELINEVRETVETKFASSEVAGKPSVIVSVDIKTSSGVSTVSRYIESGSKMTIDGSPDFIEDFGPFISYPDSRATSMTIYYVTEGKLGAINGADPKYIYGLRYKKFDLKPHKYLDIAYYCDPELKPIKFSKFKKWTIQTSKSTDS